MTTEGWKYLEILGPYKAELFGQISLPQNPRQKTFWVSVSVSDS